MSDENSKRTIADSSCPDRIATGGNCCWDGFADKDCDEAARRTADDADTEP